MLMTFNGQSSPFFMDVGVALDPAFLTLPPPPTEGSTSSSSSSSRSSPSSSSSYSPPPPSHSVDQPRKEKVLPLKPEDHFQTAVAEGAFLSGRVP